MIDERGLVALLYRADWRQLSLSGEVRGGREPWTWTVSELGRLRPSRLPRGFLGSLRGTRR